MLVQPSVLSSLAVPGRRLLTAATVNLTPNAKNLPGSTTLENLVNGVAGWALILALAGVVIGAAAWALGSHSQNYHQSVVGRRAVMVSALAALIIGAAPTMINFFFSTGRSVH